MHISIIGTGNMGLHLGLAFHRAGHTLQYGSRQPEVKADILEQLPKALITAYEPALKAAEVVVISLPFTAVKPFAQQHADLLRNKLVIDITNPFGNLPDNRISGPEITAQAIGEGARVVAAFKTTFWETLLEPVDPRTGIVRDVHYAGDSDQDKAIVAQLIKAIGFQPVDCGALRNSRVLDGMVPLLVELDRSYGKGNRQLAWKLL